LNHKSTPWGLAHSTRVIAEGIVFHSTSSHGGFELSEQRLAAMPPALAAIRPFAGEGWYEEDCDWAILAIAFPQYFPPQDVWAATRTVRRCHPAAAAYVESRAGADVRWIVLQFTIHHGDKYILGVTSTSGSSWTAHFTRIRDGAEAIVHGLSSDEVNAPGPHDLSAYGDRVEYMDMDPQAGRGESGTQAKQEVSRDA
jgi:uncharacterized protein DUF7007